MIKSIKTPLFPTKEQEAKLWKSAGTARHIYNWTLDRQEENYANGGKFIGDNDLRKELTQLKQGEKAWLYEVSNNVAKQAVKDACDAYKNFFKKRAKKPRFKSRKKSKVSFYNDNIKLKVEDDKVLIEKVGWVAIELNSIPMAMKYSNPRITHDGKYWYISIGIECGNVILDTPKTEGIGIDLGIKALAFISTGEQIKNINKTNTVRKLKKKLKQKQRRVSKHYEKLKNNKRKGGDDRTEKSKNLQKLELEIKLLHRRLTNIRNNHLHQTTSSLVKANPEYIAIEDLNVSGMMKNKNLSKAIAEQKLYEFRRQITYKCEYYNIPLVIVGRFFPSSKLCSDCGVINRNLKLSDRRYKCECGLNIDRDLNASLNLKEYGRLAIQQ